MSWPEYAAEEVARLSLDYRAFRAWRAWAIGYAYPKTWKRRRVKPSPGVLDLATTEEG